MKLFILFLSRYHRFIIVLLIFLVAEAVAARDHNIADILTTSGAEIPCIQQAIEVTMSENSLSQNNIGE